MNTKNLTELSDEELLALASQPGPATDKKDAGESDIQAFFSQYDIKVGIEKVLLSEFYRMYKAWSERYICKEKFIEQCEILLNQDDCRRYVNINFRPPKKEAKSKSTDIANMYKFVNEHSIKPGNIHVHIQAIWTLYDLWALRTKKARIGLKRFVFVIKKFLPIEVHENEDYVKVNMTTKEKCEKALSEKEKQETKEEIPQS